MFPLAPPPPAFKRAGPLPALADAFGAHIAAEDRRAWVAPSSALRLDEHGRLSAMHYPPAALEEGGLRALLVYHNDRFPRATPVFSLLSAPTAAIVFDELFDASDARLVKVAERGGRRADGRQVYAVTSPTFATEYDLSCVVADVSAILGHAPVPCVLDYKSDTLDLTMLLQFEDFDVRIEATDRYGDDGGVRVRVLDKGGNDLGDPAPGVRKRRAVANGAGAGGTVAEGIATRLAAAPDYYLQHAAGKAGGRKR